MSILLLVLKNRQWDVYTGRRCSAKESVFGSLPNFCCPERKFLLNRISHPDWVKLCAELNCAPNQNSSATHMYEQDLTLNKLQWLICYKNQPTNQPMKVLKTFITVFFYYIKWIIFNSYLSGIAVGSVWPCPREPTVWQ